MLWWQCVFKRHTSVWGVTLQHHLFSDHFPAHKIALTSTAVSLQELRRPYLLGCVYSTAILCDDGRLQTLKHPKLIFSTLSDDSVSVAESLISNSRRLASISFQLCSVEKRAPCSSLTPTLIPGCPPQVLPHLPSWLWSIHSLPTVYPQCSTVSSVQCWG